MFPASVEMNEREAHWIGLDFKSNWEDLALGRVQQESILALLTETKLYRTDVHVALNDDYNTMALTQRYHDPRMKARLHDNHVMTLYNANKVVILPEPLAIVNLAQDYADLPSWVDIHSGLGMRYKKDGQKVIIFNHMMPPLLPHMNDLVDKQTTLNAIKRDIFEVKRNAVRQQIIEGIGTMNKIVEAYCIS